jgi:hypothetical protein
VARAPKPSSMTPDSSTRSFANSASPSSPRTSSPKTAVKPRSTAVCRARRCRTSRRVRARRYGPSSSRKPTGARPYEPAFHIIAKSRTSDSALRRSASSQRNFGTALEPPSPQVPKRRARNRRRRAPDTAARSPDRNVRLAGEWHRERSSDRSARAGTRQKERHPSDRTVWRDWLGSLAGVRAGRPPPGGPGAKLHPATSIRLREGPVIGPLSHRRSRTGWPRGPGRALRWRPNNHLGSPSLELVAGSRTRTRPRLFRLAT